MDKTELAKIINSYYPTAKIETFTTGRPASAFEVKKVVEETDKVFKAIAEYLNIDLKAK